MDKIKYTWGKRIKHIQKNKDLKKSYQLANGFKKVIKPNFYMPNLDKEIVKGNVFHQFMSKIEYSHHFNKVKNDFLMDEKLDRDQVLKTIKMAKKVLNNKDLKPYFSKEFEVICEKEIFTNDNKILIPDRIVFGEGKKVTLIDYKTGAPRKSDNDQVSLYASSLANMGFDVEKHCLYTLDRRLR